MPTQRVFAVPASVTPTTLGSTPTYARRPQTAASSAPVLATRVLREGGLWSGNSGRLVSWNDSDISGKPLGSLEQLGDASVEGEVGNADYNSPGTDQ